MSVGSSHYKLAHYTVNAAFAQFTIMAFLPASPPVPACPENVTKHTSAQCTVHYPSSPHALRCCVHPLCTYIHRLSLPLLVVRRPQKPHAVPILEELTLTSSPSLGIDCDTYHITIRFCTRSFGPQNVPYFSTTNGQTSNRSKGPRHNSTSSS